MSSWSARTTRPSSAGSSSGSRPPQWPPSLSGLTVGDKVIVEGLQRVRPGQPVAPGPASALIQASMKAAASDGGTPTDGARRRRSETGGQEPMISAVFVDRPRLAIVIAFVITIAGALALLQIPVAQFPDIVPPQVTVTGVFPGASAEVVEASVAQPLEAQVVGVDKMLYMKSTSGNDGSYTLTVSFALGTNPDINTVNVNNRVQTALSQLPPEVQQQGLVVQKKSSAILQFIVLYSENGEQDPLFITNYAIINVLDAISRTPGVGQASLFAKLNYSMRIWFDTQRLTSLNLAPSDVIAAIRAQSVQAPVGRIGARPISDDQQFQFNVQTQGRLTTPEQFGNIVLRANPDGSVLRVSDVARVEIGAQNLDSESRIDGRAGVPIGIYLAPGANAVTTAKAVQATLQKLSARFPTGLTYLVQYDSTTFVTRHHHRGAEDARRSLRPRGDRGVPVPRQFARHHHPGGRGSGQPDRHLRRAAGARLFGQHGVAAGDGARDRHRGRRRHRRGRERRARDGGGAGSFAGRSHQEGDDPDHRADHRDHAGAAVGVRADRLHSRNFRHAVPPVRGDDQRRDGDLGLECADIVAGAVRGVPASHRTAARHHGARARRHRLGSRRLCRRRAPAGADGRAVARARAGVRGRHIRCVAANADRVPAGRRSGRVLHLGAIA